MTVEAEPIDWETSIRTTQEKRVRQAFEIAGAIRDMVEKHLERKTCVSLFYHPIAGEEFLRIPYTGHGRQDRNFARFVEDDPLEPWDIKKGDSVASFIARNYPDAVGKQVRIYASREDYYHHKPPQTVLTIASPTS